MSACFGENNPSLRDYGLLQFGREKKKWLDR